MGAGERVLPEIANEERGEGVKPERGQDGAASTMRDHDAPKCTRAVKARLMGIAEPLNFGARRCRKSGRLNPVADFVEHEIADALAAIAQDLQRSLVD